jgi:hypothetical protein
MNHTISHQAAPSARLLAEPSNHIAEELRRYDEHLRDVRGLAAGTRRDRVRIVKSVAAAEVRRTRCRSCQAAAR